MGEVERNLEVVIPGGEIVLVDLENLDPNPAEIIELLAEVPAPVPTWISLCLEYYKKGFHDAAELIAVGGRDCASLIALILAAHLSTQLQASPAQIQIQLAH